MQEDVDKVQNKTNEIEHFDCHWIDRRRSQVDQKLTTNILHDRKEAT